MLGASVSEWVAWVYMATHTLRLFSDLLCDPVCFIQPVVPYLWHSTVSCITESFGSKKILGYATNFEFSHFSSFCCRFIVVHISPTRTWDLRSPPAEPHAGGRLSYDGVLPGAAKGSFATLLSPPLQCHSAFSTMPFTLSSVDQSPVCRSRTLPPPNPLRDDDTYGFVLVGILGA
jgi:hypothetical protein